MGYYLVTCKCGRSFMVNEEDVEVKKKVLCKHCGRFTWSSHIESGNQKWYDPEVYH
jgi:hypothetical protein